MSAVLFYGVLIVALFACLGILIVLILAGSDEEEQLREIEQTDKPDSPAARVHTEPQQKGDAHATAPTLIRPRGQEIDQQNPRRR